MRESMPARIWGALAEIEPPGAAVARISAPPSRLHALWTKLAPRDDAHEGTCARARNGRPRHRSLAFVRASERRRRSRRGSSDIARTEGTHIFERLPAAEWAVDPRRASTTRSRARVRAAFDPRRVLNRGILGDIA